MGQRQRWTDFVCCPASSSDILIVFALEIESQDQFHDTNLLHCGIGKVNAAFRLTQRLLDWKAQKGSFPKAVVNLGSAGSREFAAGEVVNCTRFIQRDFDATGLGIPPYVTPFETLPKVLANGLALSGFKDGICGTGDSFVTSGTMTEWNVVDMEAYALAKVCLLSEVSFYCFKFISDGADGSAHENWQAGLLDTAKTLKARLGLFIS